MTIWSYFDHIIGFVLNYLVNQILISIAIDKWFGCTNHKAYIILVYSYSSINFSNETIAYIHMLIHVGITFWFGNW